MNNVRVSKAGSVSVDDMVIGRVEKVHTIPEYGRATTDWYVLDNDEVTLGRYDTRKEAVDHLLKRAEPLQISDLKKTEHWLGGTFIEAYIRHQGYSYGVSRYPDESAWTVDLYSTPSSVMPVYCNGAGSRVTSLHILQGPVAEAVTKAAQEAGLL